MVGFESRGQKNINYLKIENSLLPFTIGLTFFNKQIVLLGIYDYLFNYYFFLLVK